MAENPFDTFRLRGFPPDFTSSSFISFLSQNKLEPIGNASLAADAACSCSARTATLTLKREQGRKSQLPNAWGKLSLKVDELMEGFTPLSEVGDTQDYVEYVTKPPKSIAISIDSTPSSIVGITGLAGRAFGSWQCKTGEMWLRDFIPRDVRNVRTHIYGYPSALQKSTSTAGLLHYTETFARLLKIYLEDEPIRRPLILVGHSLGCLVIKQMLVEYAQHPAYRRIVDRVYSIVLFGAPHRGLNTAALETLVEQSRREPLIKDLKCNSTLLEFLRKKFVDASKAIKIVTCYEMKETPTSVPKPGKLGEWERTGPLAMMVEPSSACLYTVNEQQIGIDNDHSEIGKLQRSWPSYQAIKEVLTNHVPNAQRAISARFSHQDAVKSLREICWIGHGLVSAFLAAESQRPHLITAGPITSVRLLGTALEFFDHFRTFLEDEVSIAILQRDSLQVPFAQRIAASISEVEADFIVYQKFSTDRVAALWNQFGEAALETNPKRSEAIPFDRTDPVLNSDRIVALSTKASRCATRIRREAIFAMLGLREDSASERISQCAPARTIGLSEVALKQLLARRASESFWDSRELAPLDGFLDPQDPTAILHLASYFSQPGAPAIDVIIERRQYGQTVGTALANPAMQRTLEEQEQRGKRQLAHLSFLLKKMTEAPDEGIIPLSSGDFGPCMMRCLGYVDETDRKPRQTAILFEVPRLRDGSSARDIIDLHSAITGKSALQSLGQRFRLARHVCLQVFNLHSWGWLHKDIRSQNILLVPVSDSSEPFVPYLRGFEYARHSAHSTTLTATHELEMNLYRHPDRQGKPTAEFKKMHDLYAVGVVLYEIATLRTVRSRLDSWLNQFFKRNSHPPSEMVAKELQRRAASDLPVIMGSKYAEAVRRCLESDFDVLQDDEVQTEMSIRFRDLVMDPIDAGCYL